MQSMEDTILKPFFLKEGEEQHPLINKTEGIETITVSSSLLEQICYRKTSKAIAVAQAKEHGLETFRQKSENPFILVAEAPEKPGNIGALLRTADAMGVDCFIIVDAKTDLYNPNVVRSSVGCLFSVPVISTSLTEVFDFFITTTSNSTAQH